MKINIAAAAPEVDAGRIAATAKQNRKPSYGEAFDTAIRHAGGKNDAAPRASLKSDDREQPGVAASLRGDAAAETHENGDAPDTRAEPPASGETTAAPARSQALLDPTLLHALHAHGESAARKGADERPEAATASGGPEGGREPTARSTQAPALGPVRPAGGSEATPDGPLLTSAFLERMAGPALPGGVGAIEELVAAPLSGLPGVADDAAQAALGDGRGLSRLRLDVVHMETHFEPQIAESMVAPASGQRGAAILSLDQLLAPSRAGVPNLSGETSDLAATARDRSAEAPRASVAAILPTLKPRAAVAAPAAARAVPDLPSLVPAQQPGRVEAENAGPSGKAGGVPKADMPVPAIPATRQDRSTPGGRPDRAAPDEGAAATATAFRRTAQDRPAPAILPAAAITRSNDAGLSRATEATADSAAGGAQAPAAAVRQPDRVRTEPERGAVTLPERGIDRVPEPAADRRAAVGEPLRSNIEARRPEPAQAVPERAADRVPKHAADRLPEHAADSLPEHAADSLPERAADRLPDRAADRLPDRASDKLPAQDGKSAPDTSARPAEPARARLERATDEPPRRQMDTGTRQAERSAVTAGAEPRQVDRAEASRLPEPAVARTLPLPRSGVQDRQVEALKGPVASAEELDAPEVNTAPDKPVLPARSPAGVDAPVASAELRPRRIDEPARAGLGRQPENAASPELSGKTPGETTPAQGGGPVVPQPQPETPFRSVQTRDRTEIIRQDLTVAAGEPDVPVTGFETVGAAAAESQAPALGPVMGQLTGRILQSLAPLRSERPAEGAAEGHLRLRAGGAALKTLQIQLHPEDLGTLDVSLRLVDGRLTVELAATEPDTARRLADDRAGLQKLLEHAGFSLDDGAITIVTRETALQAPQRTGPDATPQPYAGDAGNRGRDDQSPGSRHPSHPGSEKGREQQPGREPESPQRRRIGDPSVYL